MWRLKKKEAKATKYMMFSCEDLPLQNVDKMGCCSSDTSEINKSQGEAIGEDKKFKVKDSKNIFSMAQASEDTKGYVGDKDIHSTTEYIEDPHPSKEKEGRGKQDKKTTERVQRETSNREQAPTSSGATPGDEPYQLVIHSVQVPHGASLLDALKFALSQAVIKLPEESSSASPTQKSEELQSSQHVSPSPPVPSLKDSDPKKRMKKKKTQYDSNPSNNIVPSSVAPKTENKSTLPKKTPSGPLASNKILSPISSTKVIPDTKVKSLQQICKNSIPKANQIITNQSSPNVSPKVSTKAQNKEKSSPQNNPGNFNACSQKKGSKQKNIPMVIPTEKITLETKKNEKDFVPSKEYDMPNKNTSKKKTLILEKNKKEISLSDSSSVSTDCGDFVSTNPYKNLSSGIENIQLMTTAKEASNLPKKVYIDPKENSIKSGSKFPPSMSSKEKKILKLTSLCQSKQAAQGASSSPSYTHSSESTETNIKKPLPRNVKSAEKDSDKQVYPTAAMLESKSLLEKVREDIFSALAKEGVSMEVFPTTIPVPVKNNQTPLPINNNLTLNKSKQTPKKNNESPTHYKKQKKYIDNNIQPNSLHGILKDPGTKMSKVKTVSFVYQPLPQKYPSDKIVLNTEKDTSKLPCKIVKDNPLPQNISDDSESSTQKVPIDVFVFGTKKELTNSTVPKLTPKDKLSMSLNNYGDRVVSRSKPSNRKKLSFSSEISKNEPQNNQCDTTLLNSEQTMESSKGVSQKKLKTKQKNVKKETIPVIEKNSLKQNCSSLESDTKQDMYNVSTSKNDQLLPQTLQLDQEIQTSIITPQPFSTDEKITQDFSTPTGTKPKIDNSGTPAKGDMMEPRMKEVDVVVRRCRNENCSKIEDSSRYRLVACYKCLSQNYPDVNYFCNLACHSSWWEEKHRAEHLQFLEYTLGLAGYL